MAKENFVGLYGKVKRIVIDQNDDDPMVYNEAVMEVEVLRRPYIRNDFKLQGKNISAYPPVYTRNSELIRLGMSNIKPGDYVLVRGNIVSKQVDRMFICKKTGEMMYDNLAMDYYIDPSFVRKIKDASVDDGLDPSVDYSELECYYDISNRAVLLGMVAQDVRRYDAQDDFGNTRSSITFNLAVNRVRYIKEDPPNEDVDFIWVYARNELADRIGEDIKKGSIVIVYGAIATRPITRRLPCQSIECRDKTCDGMVVKDGKSTMVCAYDIIIINDDKIRRLENVTREDLGYPNEAFMLGIVEKAYFLRKDDVITKWRAIITTKKRTEATGESKMCPKYKYESVVIETSDPGMIDTMRNRVNVEEGDMIFVYGSIVSKHVRKKLTCLDCGTRFSGKESSGEYHTPFVDPVRVLVVEPFDRNKYNQSQNDNRKKELLRKCYEISDQVIIVGEIDEDIPEENYIHDEAANGSSTLKDEFTFFLKVSRVRHALQRDVRIHNDKIKIKSYGKMAAELHSALHRGSIIEVNGAIESEIVKNMYTGRCPICGKMVKEDGYNAWALPYRVEYLKDCEVPETDTEENIQNDTGSGAAENDD